MDRECSVCTQVTDDATGVCRFCGGEYKEAKAAEPAETVDGETEDV